MPEVPLSDVRRGGADDQAKGAISELQPLDVPQLVGTVERILDGMGDLDGAVGVAGERILRLKTLVLGGVDVARIVSSF